MSLPKLILTAAALLAILPGCGQKTQSPETPRTSGGVGVVDLDVVAKRLGRDIEITNSVEERMTSLNGKLTTLQGSLKRLYDEKRETFGEEPDADEQKQLKTIQERMDVQLLESKRNAETELAKYKQALVNQFREQARPVLREVAAARGLSIVIPKNNALLLSIDPAVEITDQVAERMLAVQPAKKQRTPESDKTDAGEATKTSSR